MKRQPKVQRWTDLIAALFRYKFPVEFKTLAKSVPAYAMHGGSESTLMRMFERDKDELRALGVPIETLPDSDNNMSRYRLAPGSFYLPYITIAGERPASAARPAVNGLEVLAFEPDELAMVMRAAQRVEQLGDKSLAREARSAKRKLGHDKPETRTPKPDLVVTDDRIPSELFDTIISSIRTKKFLSFDYHTIGSDKTARRNLMPYGIAYVSSHWYLIGRDVTANALRQFRMTRMSNAERNKRAPSTPDFAVPADFDLWKHAESRPAWELGDAEAVEVVTRFRIGAMSDWARLGAPVADDPTLRSFRVRRTDAFCRWLLGFAGAARPVSPSEIVAEYESLVERTLAVYTRVTAGAA